MHFVDRRFRLDQRTRNLLRLGAYQLLHLDKIPPHAAIYETVELAKPKRKAARFINAVLRSVQREADSLAYPSLESHPAQHIAISLSYPLWLVERWLKHYGVEWTLAFCRASNQVAPLSIRVNTLKTNRADLIQSLTADGGCAKESQIAPDALLLSDSPSLQSLQAYRNGGFYVQDESAMLVTHLLHPEPGQKVIDLCAAPGGKTTHIAQLMGNAGELIAVDVSQDRAERIAENCQRLGIANVQTKIMDAANTLLDFLEDADGVLIDTPCSALGTLRRHPDVRWKKKPEQIDKLVRLQSRLLHNAARKVKPDGVLVYSTCSTEPEENEAIIHRFLKTHPHFILENAGDFLPFVPSSAITSEGFLQTFPHEHGIDGAFAARLRAGTRQVSE
jgi:16S rRNA (cytosine967-C5)-methyltransferase